MLAKNEKIFCDAHFHYADCIEQNSFDICDFLWKGCSCAHSKEEWEIQNGYIPGESAKIVKAFGLHPQSAAFINMEENLDFLESLLKNKSISAVGEAGFDLFTAEYRDNKIKQEEMFIKQMELSVKYKVPVIIHCRKANDKLFEYSGILKLLPAVLFHSFMGMPMEAVSLLNRGINGYFSFGKQLLNNNKKAIGCAVELPLERLICETDAPYQYLKNENKTCVSEIQKVYEALINLRKEDEEHIFSQLNKNFDSLFMNGY